MPVFNNILAGSSGQSTGYDIDQSLRFDDGDSAYLRKVFSGAGNRRTWTLSLWVKRGHIGTPNKTLFYAGADTFQFYIHADKLKLYVNSAVMLETTALYRDPSSWYHIVLAMDTTQSIDTNRLKLYVNGSQVTALGTINYPVLNTEFDVGNAVQHSIGAWDTDDEFYDGYLAEVHFIDGTALGPASFGETNSDTNQWQAIEYSGSYGTNGFYLKFGGEGFLTYDRESEIAVTSSFTWLFTSSGNTDGEDLVNGLVTNNDAGGGWMPSGDVTDRWIKFDFGSGKVYKACQWITINSTGSEGTWKWQGSNNDSDWTDIGGTFTLGGSSSGSNVTYTLGDTLNGNTTSYRYYRILGTTGSANTNGRRLAMYFSETVYGLGGDSSGQGNNFSENNLSWSDQVLDSPTNNYCVLNPIDTNTTGTLSEGNLVTSGNARVTMQPESGQWYYEKDGSGVSVSGAFNPSLTSGTYNFGSSGTGGYADGNGEGNFDNAVPSGYLAVCSDNLPDPSIALPTDHFNTVLYDDGAGAKTGVGFQPDLVWVKSRGSAYENELTDSVRGVTKALSSDSVNAETTDSTGLTAFGADGFTVGADTNYSDTTGTGMVSWNWKAGGAAASNGDGSITSSVSANTTAGFSIAAWTGDGNNGASVGHGLSSIPELIITKNRDDAYNWQTVSTELTSKEYLLYLNTTDAQFTTSSYVGYTWNSSVITFPSSGYYGTFNVSGDDYIAYCFHSVEGYSKVGSYTGNGNADGNFIYTGFRPAYVFFKCTSASSTAWNILDTTREDDGNTMSEMLQANNTIAEFTSSSNITDFLSNGIKLRGTSSATNGSGNTYIYLAFAASPFKTSNAR